MLFNQIFKQQESFSWEEFYGSIINKPNKKFTFKHESLNIKFGETYVYNCYFSYLCAKDGGAILYSVSDSYLLVEKCYINNCTATRYTAGIRVSKGNCIIAFVCGQKGYSHNNDGFCSITNDDSNRKINSVFDSSISQCEAGNTYIMAHSYGCVYIKSVNLSHNKAKYDSALCCNPSKINEETNYGSDIIFCSFYNNTATFQQCIQMNNQYNTSCLHQMKNCNIIENNSSKTIYSRGNANIYFSSFVNNISPYFSFYTQEPKIILSMCYTDKETELGSISQNENQISDSSILSLPYLQTGFCDISFYQCTENSFLQNFYIHKIISSPFIFLLLSK